MLALASTHPHETLSKPIKTAANALDPTSNVSRVMNSSACPQITPHKPTISAIDSHLREAITPGTMEFNDAQKAHWALHTPPRVSPKFKKLAMLRQVAYDQEIAGVRFNGRRSFAEVEAELVREQWVQASQAARIQNPLEFIGDSFGDLLRGLSYYFESTPSISTVVDQLSAPIGDTPFYVWKSKSLEQREIAGDDIPRLGIGLIDSGHTSEKVQNEIKIFLEKYFNPERGDIFLTEAVSVIEVENGKEKFITPSIEKHHTLLCRGISMQYCRFISEPENETAQLIAALEERRDLVNRVFEFFMNAIPPSKALEARQKLKERNKKNSAWDTGYKLELLATYQDHCDPNKANRLNQRVNLLKDAYKKQKLAEKVTNSARDKTYFRQICETLKELKPGAKLYYLLGKEHFDRLDNSLNEIDTLFVNTHHPKQ
jgi:hypothetical protein